MEIGNVIALGLVILSFYFGYAGKSMKYILLLFLVGIVGPFIMQPENIPSMTTLLDPILGVILLVSFAMSLALLYIAWWIGWRISGKRRD